jgi:hypothetical protein
MKPVKCLLPGRRQNLARFGTADTIPPERGPADECGRHKDRRGKPAPRQLLNPQRNRAPVRVIKGDHGTRPTARYISVVEKLVQRDDVVRPYQSIQLFCEMPAGKMGGAVAAWL